MNKEQALDKMVPPGKVRAGKPAGGVIQIWITRRCNLSCFHCTQGSNYKHPKSDYPDHMPPDQFAKACESLKGYFGTVGVFGGNPAMHPQFELICDIMRKIIPFKQRGLWCNDPLTETKGRAMAATFNPSVSNLNCHLKTEAYKRFRQYWPTSRPFGVNEDSRHSPVYVSMKDVGVPEEDRWKLISECDINQHWSAMISTFRGELRGWFCEIAGSMSMLKQNDPNWPDTGLKITPDWWKRPMGDFADQVMQHCHDCGVPMRGIGELAMENDNLGTELTSEKWKDVAVPKRDRSVGVLYGIEPLKPQSLGKMTHYIQNASK